jgi:hypothetical protein
VNDSRLILLHEDDNVLVCIAPIAAADSFSVDGAVVHAATDIGVGHKVARRAIGLNEKIVKYGAPIGSATTEIAAGAWVHSHNMRSDHIASHSRQTLSEGPTQ